MRVCEWLCVMVRIETSGWDLVNWRYRGVGYFWVLLSKKGFLSGLSRDVDHCLFSML